MKPTILILAALLLAPRPSAETMPPVGDLDARSSVSAPRTGEVEPPQTTEAPAPTVAVSHPPQPTPVSRDVSAAMSGIIATWYCLPGRSRCTVGYPASCLCAAASRDLHLRGKRITVTYRGRSVTVKVIDCLCSRAGGLDLYASAWVRLAPLGLGEITVAWR